MVVNMRKRTKRLPTYWDYTHNAKGTNCISFRDEIVTDRNNRGEPSFVTKEDIERLHKLSDEIHKKIIASKVTPRFNRFKSGFERSNKVFEKFHWEAKTPKQREEFYLNFLKNPFSVFEYFNIIEFIIFFFIWALVTIIFIGLVISLFFFIIFFFKSLFCWFFNSDLYYMIRLLVLKNNIIVEIFAISCLAFIEYTESKFDEDINLFVELLDQEFDDCYRGDIDFGDYEYATHLSYYDGMVEVIDEVDEEVLEYYDDDEEEAILSKLHEAHDELLVELKMGEVDMGDLSDKEVYNDLLTAVEYEDLDYIDVMLVEDILVRKEQEEAPKFEFLNSLFEFVKKSFKREITIDDLTFFESYKYWEEAKKELVQEWKDYVYLQYIRSAQYKEDSKVNWALSEYNQMFFTTINEYWENSVCPDEEELYAAKQVEEKESNLPKDKDKDSTKRLESELSEFDVWYIDNYVKKLNILRPKWVGIGFSTDFCELFEEHPDLHYDYFDEGFGVYADEECLSVIDEVPEVFYGAADSIDLLNWTVDEFNFNFIKIKPDLSTGFYFLSDEAREGLANNFLVYYKKQLPCNNSMLKLPKNYLDYNFKGIRDLDLDMFFNFPLELPFYPLTKISLNRILDDDEINNLNGFYDSIYGTSCSKQLAVLRHDLICNLDDSSEVMLKERLPFLVKMFKKTGKFLDEHSIKEELWLELSDSRTERWVTFLEYLDQEVEPPAEDDEMRVLHSNFYQMPIDFWINLDDGLLFKNLKLLFQKYSLENENKEFEETDIFFCDRSKLLIKDKKSIKKALAILVDQAFNETEKSELSFFHTMDLGWDAVRLIEYPFIYNSWGLSQNLYTDRKNENEVLGPFILSEVLTDFDAFTAKEEENETESIFFDEEFMLEAFPFLGERFELVDYSLSETTLKSIGWFMPIKIIPKIYDDVVFPHILEDFEILDDDDLTAEGFKQSSEKKISELKKKLKKKD